MGTRRWLYRFEDNFEPENCPKDGDKWSAVLDHIMGKCSSFYSYGTHLIPCMAKYYHYPTDNEAVSLYVKETFTEAGIDIGHFDDVSSACAFFGEKCPNKEFPSEYPFIEDGEILFSDKLSGCTAFRFGYSVYFLVMLTALVGRTAGDKSACFDSVVSFIGEHLGILSSYGVTDISEDDISIANCLVMIYFNTDDKRYAIEDILKMPVWATTFEQEKFRHETLKGLYKKYLVSRDSC